MACRVGVGADRNVAHTGRMGARANKPARRFKARAATVDVNLP